MANRFKRTLPSRHENKSLGEGKEVKSELFDDLFDEVEEQEKKSLHIMGLVDATGSMHPFWDFTKKTIVGLVNNMSEYGDIHMNWVAYRDYDLGKYLLEESGWTNNSQHLVGFLNGIQCMANNTVDEAVEYALNHAAKDQTVECVFLVGDYPPHHSTVKNPLDKWVVASKVLGQQKKKVYTFQVGNVKQTVSFFKEIAKLTGGAYCKLNSSQDFLSVLQLIIGKELNEDAYAEILDTLKKKYGGALPENINTFSGLLGTGE